MQSWFRSGTVILVLLAVAAGAAIAQDAGSSATRAETEPIWVARLFLIPLGDGEAAEAAAVFHEEGIVDLSDETLSGDAIAEWLAQMVREDRRFFVKADCVADTRVTIDARDGTTSEGGRPVRLVFHTREGYIDALEVHAREASEVCDQ